MYYILICNLIVLKLPAHALSHGFLMNYEISRTNILIIKNEEIETWGGLSKLPQITWLANGRILSLNCAASLFNFLSMPPNAIFISAHSVSSGWNVLPVHLHLHDLPK